MTSPTAEELARRAALAERTARGDEAEELWNALLAAFPAHPKALFIQGRRRVEQGDPAGGLSLLTQAEAGDRADPEIPLYLALAHRMLGANETALAAIERALAIDPYFFLAQLSKGALLERTGKPRLAARTYRNAIKIAPSADHLPAVQRGALDHAKRVVAENASALAAHLRERTGATRRKFPSEGLERFDECLDILAGIKPRFVQDPLLLCFPRLAPIPFHDRALFPWLGEVEAATEMLREELFTVLREDRAKFAPYIQFPPGAPVNQWAELNYSPAWTSFFLWRDGVRQNENCARCPGASALLDRLPLAHQRGYGPSAMFSVLSPRTRIPPHTGSANTRLIAHLPLILPPSCGFRVGNDSRDWRMGEAWVFDDTIEHEAWNDSEETRVILIFDVWNPLLTQAERELVCEMMEALNTYNTEGG